MGIGGQDTYIMTKACLALWFWQSMNFASSIVSKKQSNGNASWVYYMYSSLALVHANVDVGNLYIHIRGAFSVARFDLQGNAKAYRSWNE